MFLKNITRMLFYLFFFAKPLTKKHLENYCNDLIFYSCCKLSYFLRILLYVQHIIIPLPGPPNIDTNTVS